MSWIYDLAAIEYDGLEKIEWLSTRTTKIDPPIEVEDYEELRTFLKCCEKLGAKFYRMNDDKGCSVTGWQRSSTPSLTIDEVIGIVNNFGAYGLVWPTDQPQRVTRLDIDDHHGRRAFKTWDFPPTVKVKTPNGEHYYFRCYPGIELADIISEGAMEKENYGRIGIFTRGKFTIGPGSWIKGKEYVIDDDNEFEFTELPKEAAQFFVQLKPPGSNDPKITNLKSTDDELAPVCSPTDDEIHDIRTILAQTNPRGINWCEGNDDFLRFAWSMKWAFGNEKAHELCMEQGGKTRDIHKRIWSLPIRSRQMANFIALAKDKGVPLQELELKMWKSPPQQEYITLPADDFNLTQGEVAAPVTDSDLEGIGAGRRNNTLKGVIWKLVTNKLPVETIVAEVERLNNLYVTPRWGDAKGEESIQSMVERAVKKFDGKDTVTRKNALYDLDDDCETTNCLNMLEVLGYESRYNELKMRYELRKVGEASVKAWKDAFDDTVFQSLLLSVRNDLVPRPILVRSGKTNEIRRGEKRGQPVGDKNFERQLKGACLRRRENPFLLLLDDLDKWGKQHFPNLEAEVDHAVQEDKIEELELVSPTLLEHCFKVHESYEEVARFAIPAMMRAAIMRSYKPGAKYDEVVILCGQQGIGKGEFFKTLLRVLGDDELDMYTEDFDLNCTSKELIENTAGMKFVELSEMAGMKQVDSAKLKAKVSRPKDGARLAWGRTRTDALRQFVFMGSADQTDFLNLPATDFGRRWLVIGIEMQERAEGSRVKSAQWINSSEIALLIKRAWYEQLLLYRAGVKCYVPADLVETIAANVQEHRFRDEEAEALATQWLQDNNHYITTPFTADDITRYLDQFKLAPQLGQRMMKVLKGWGFRSKVVKVEGKAARRWGVVEPTKLPSFIPRPKPKEDQST